MQQSAVEGLSASNKLDYSFGRIKVHPGNQHPGAALWVQPEPGDLQTGTQSTIQRKSLQHPPVISSFMPDRTGLLQRCSCEHAGGMQGGCDECKKKHAGALQRKQGEKHAENQAPPIVQQALNSPGQSLEFGVRSFMESRFESNFSRVRIHTDQKAAESAKAVNALAYTVKDDIVFNSNQYLPQTPAGQKLLAHELVHVLQQRNSSPAGSSLTINHPDGADEVEADRVSAHIMEENPVGSLPSTGPIWLQRTVDARVVSSFPSNRAASRVCLVHLHADEQNAFSTAQDIHSRYCSNFVRVENGAGAERCVRISLPGNRRCWADPNRIFTSNWERHAFSGSCRCPARDRRAALAELSTFRDQLINQIAQCRGGTGTDVLQGTLPVIAFHNNTQHSGLSIHSYERRGAEAGATERDPAATGGHPNPTIQPPATADQRTDPDNFFLTTRPADFAGLGAHYNVVLQSAHPADDSSLSVALGSTPYINVEAGGKTPDAGIVTFNTAMAEAALTQLGINPGPCPSARAATGASTGRTEDQPTGPGRVARKIGSAPAVSIKPPVSQISRQPPERGRTPPSAQPAPSRQATPSPAVPSCLSFRSQSDLDRRKNHWRRFINSRAGASPFTQVVQWIIGVTQPPQAVRDEVTNQRNCLFTAITATRPRLPAPSVVGRSGDGYRSFQDQQTIWQNKFTFDWSIQPFDRITSAARSKCGTLIRRGEDQWNPRNMCHRVCWGVTTPGTLPQGTSSSGAAAPACPAICPAPGTSCAAPPMPAGASNLTPAEREMEILQASSAPGVSRHHWGTDFDLNSVSATQWAGAVAPLYDWLAGTPGTAGSGRTGGQAATFGFIQSFTSASGGYGTGYMDEPWHWSYFPVAQALLDWINVRTPPPSSGGGTAGCQPATGLMNACSPHDAVEAALNAQWGSGHQFDFIRSHWSDFMSHVGQQGAF